MKGSTVDVLMFLFDHYLGAAVDGDCTEDAIAFELEEAGFSPPEINHAFDWLGELQDMRDVFALSQPKAFRVLTPLERNRMDLSCQGYLLTLGLNGLISPLMREVILDRVMAIDAPIGLQHFQRMVGMICMNLSDDAHIQAWAETLMYGDLCGFLQ